MDINKRQFFVYILASSKNGTLYVGVTNDLIRRIYEHKQCLVEGFTKRYKVHILVYYETYYFIYDAIQREKILKKLHRKEKINLIERENPNWKDLYDDLL